MFRLHNILSLQIYTKRNINQLASKLIVDDMEENYEALITCATIFSNSSFFISLSIATESFMGRPAGSCPNTAESTRGFSNY
jgi:hypothetical protein